MSGFSDPVELALRRYLVSGLVGISREIPRLSKAGPQPTGFIADFALFAISSFLHRVGFSHFQIFADLMAVPSARTLPPSLVFENRRGPCRLPQKGTGNGNH